MNEEIDRLRRENGWKPRKRGKSQVAIVDKWFLNENSTKYLEIIVDKWFLNENSNKSQEIIVHTGLLFKNNIK